LVPRDPEGRQAIDERGVRSDDRMARGVAVVESGGGVVRIRSGIATAVIFGGGIRGWRSEPAPFRWQNMTQRERIVAIAKGARSRGNSMLAYLVAWAGDEYASYEVLP
jgi:hypothetical protein